MINVIASIRVRPGSISDFLEIFKDNMLAVLKEKGCIEYFPAIDMDSGLPSQIPDENVVTIIEKWLDLDALHAHLESAHMLAYREKVKDIVETVHLKILKEA
jgi:quinol monooxygenase YgiN